MKFVRKGGAPHGYRLWCRSVKGTNKEDYREIPTDMKSLVLSALIREQGQICAYTMRRIGNDTSHIEHVRPESLCRIETRGSDLAFSNMAACFPRDGMLSAWRYGAQKKDSWWDAALFVSPFDFACERRFHFNLAGEMSAVGTSAAARNTISVLALNHPALTEDRRRAISEYIYGQGGDEPLSKAKAFKLRGEVCAKSAGRFVEFCVALRDALDAHIEYVEKLARKKKFLRKRRR
jgi:uncharacterized protein (TIGR02646 family)